VWILESNQQQQSALAVIASYQRRHQHQEDWIRKLSQVKLMRHCQ
jgi:hypothetical protein